MTNDLLKDKLQKGCESGWSVANVWMSRDEILRLIYLIDRDAEPVDMQNYEKAYTEGFNMGRQRAIVDAIKVLKGMKWYGGDKQKKRAAGVPEHHEERAGDLQQTLQRPGTGEGNGRGMETGTGEGEDPGGPDPCV